MALPLKLEGKSFGKLTVISEGNHIGVHRGWICSCECGGSSLVRTGNLMSGATTSCGCVAKEVRTKYMERLKKSWETHKKFASGIR